MEIFFIFLTELIIQGIVIYFYNYKPFIDFSISICMVFFFCFVSCTLEAINILKRFSIRFYSVISMRFTKTIKIYDKF